jgi:hypothetical protein
MTVIALTSSSSVVDPIEIRRERFAQDQARRRQTLNDQGYNTVVVVSPTDAQLRAAQTPQKFEALVIRCTRPANFASASSVTPWRYPRVAVR